MHCQNGPGHLLRGGAEHGCSVARGASRLPRSAISEVQLQVGNTGIDLRWY